MSTDKPVSSKDARNKLDVEIRCGNVVFEIFEKIDPKTNKVFFDFKVCRAFVVNAEGDESRGPFCQQRDLRDLIKAAVDTMTWVSDAHRDMRNNSAPYQE